MRILTALSILTLLVSGCDHPAPGTPPGTPPLSERRNAAYELAESGFERVDLVFPAPDSTRMEINLAPLIVQELGDDDGAADRIRPRVDFRRATVTLGGQPRQQICYRWSHPAGTTAKVMSTQGVRLTLDASGYPAVIELLARQDGLRIIYVSKSLEEMARAAHGDPLDGRRHAIERSVDERPAVVVARVLAAGPAPLGPFVYLQRGTRNAVTMLCRCEPSRLSDAHKTHTYVLEERAVAPSDEEELLDDAADPRWLEHALRLPEEF